MDDNGPFQTTPREELQRQIMDCNVPKNEREHWAARRIAELERENQRLRVLLDNAKSAIQWASETLKGAPKPAVDTARDPIG
jgi:hypothetical protein